MAMYQELHHWENAIAIAASRVSKNKEIKDGQFTCCILFYIAVCDVLTIEPSRAGRSAFRLLPVAARYWPR